MRGHLKNEPTYFYNSLDFEENCEDLCGKDGSWWNDNSQIRVILYMCVRGVDFIYTQTPHIHMKVLYSVFSTFIDIHMPLTCSQFSARSNHSYTLHFKIECALKLLKKFTYICTIDCVSLHLCVLSWIVLVSHCSSGGTLPPLCQMVGRGNIRTWDCFVNILRCLPEAFQSS